MQLKCIRCRRAIEPTDRMVVITTGLPYGWVKNVTQRLEIAPKWHWQCAPKPVRQYAPAVTIEEYGQMIVVVAAASLLVFVMEHVPMIDSVIELVFTILGGNA